VLEFKYFEICDALKIERDKWFRDSLLADSRDCPVWVQ
jgi:hypothetical protein